MKIRHLLLGAAAMTVVAGCESPLDVDPTTAVPNEKAIVDAVSARAALAGAYDALQDQSFYAEVMFTWGELSADNAAHTGTFTSYADADQNVLTADNGQIEATWDAIYDAINRANILIARVPSVPGLTDAEKNQVVGEAHFIRALSYHSLVKYWTGVPIRTEPVASITEASNVTRASVAEVYTQILSDLQQAEALMTNERQTRAGSRGAARALRARVLLYRASPGPTGSSTGDWAAVEAAASSVIAMPYSLASSFTDLFTPTGANTTEDIFRLRFNDQDPFWAGYYYLVKSLGGRYEVAPTASVRTAFEAGDARLAATIKNDPSRSSTQTPRYYAAKFPTPTGTEHPAILRLAEVILIRAEARARQGNLLGALEDYNLLRARAGLPQHVLGVHVTDQASVLAAIARERRSELAFEGDRWPDLVRSGQVVATMNLATKSHQAIYPIPQNEVDVTSGQLSQNPGY
jgi:starch-binding outer membrane protein, SusD/RagB family